MFKQLVILAIAICAVKAGVIGGLGYGGYGHGAVIAAPVAHVAESYQNNNQISLHPTPIVVSHAAPVIAKVAAPVLVSSHGIGLGGLGYGGHGLIH